MEGVLDGVIRRAQAAKSEKDFIENGLLHCGKCGQPKECRVQLLGKTRTVGCMCRCEIERESASELEEQQKEAQRKLDRLRQKGMVDNKILDMRFDVAEETQAIRLARTYAQTWETSMHQGKPFGLLFWGDPGCGKTFAAGCITNALLEKGVPVLMTSFPKILALPFENRTMAISELVTAPLLVIDDLGVERVSAYSMETMYMVVDECYKNGTPMIVTTNLYPNAMRSVTDIKYRRIYDRVLEMCTPVKVDGRNRREENAKKQLQRAAELFAGKGSSDSGPASRD